MVLFVSSSVPYQFCKTALFEVFATSVLQGMLVGVFRSILNIVQQKALTDFHLKIQNGWHH